MRGYIGSLMYGRFIANPNETPLDFLRSKRHDVRSGSAITVDKSCIQHNRYTPYLCYPRLEGRTKRQIMFRRDPLTRTEIKDAGISVPKTIIHFDFSSKASGISDKKSSLTQRTRNKRRQDSM